MRDFVSNKTKYTNENTTKQYGAGKLTEWVKGFATKSDNLS